MNWATEIRGRGQWAWDVTREASASVLTYELYPLTALGNSFPALPTMWSGKNPENRPILFIHGIFHNKAAFVWLKQKLANRGWHHFREVDLMSSLYKIPRLAARIAREVENLRDEYQTDQVDIVAHSMGGIIARYYLQALGGDGRVRNLITLGTPHQGTQLKALSFVPQVKELGPKSGIITELNAMPVPQFTRALSVSGKMDVFMVPRSCTHWEGVRNIELARVGHAGLLFSRRVFQILTSHLG